MAQATTPGGLAGKLQQLDRRWIFLLVAAGTVLPIIFPIGLPVSITPPVRGLFDKIETFGSNDVVMVSFDYGPTTKPENGPMATAILRHCFSRRAKVVVIALYPIGGSAMAAEALTAVLPEFPDLVYGVDYVNLGYKDGAQALMKQMGQDIHAVFPTDAHSTPLAQIPLMERVHNYRDIGLVVSLATGIIGEWWANLINAQFGVPVAVGCTAVSAPKYYAYLDTGQMIGLLGGLKGASEYERLLLDRYPELSATYSDPMVFNAIRGMDVQTTIHLVIIFFIIVGNLAYFLSRAKTRPV